MIRPSRTWLYYWLAWIPVAGLYTAVLAQEVPLVYAITSGLSAIVTAALLGLVVWWVSGWFSWRGPGKIVFAVGQTVFALLYAAAWTGLTLVRLGVWSGWDEAMLHVTREGGWWFMSGFWLYGLLAGGSYAVRAEREVLAQREAMAHIETARARAEALRSQAEFRALRARLNPHFLFNTLHSIRSLAQRDPAIATEAIDKLGMLLRQVLDLDRIVGDGDETSLGDELRFVRSYLDLERLRLGDRLIVVEEVDDSTLEIGLPPLTLQPLVENAIRHGIAPRASGGTLTLTARRDRGELVVEVRDDGAGATLDEVETAPGIGIRAVRGQLETRYPEGGRLDIVTTPGAGFTTIVTIPARDIAKGAA